jgi:hypothetical protein
MEGADGKGLKQLKNANSLYPSLFPFTKSIWYVFKELERDLNLFDITHVRWMDG